MSESIYSAHIDDSMFRAVGVLNHIPHAELTSLGLGYFLVLTEQAVNSASGF
jgi:hypothetical protein